MADENMQSRFGRANAVADGFLAQARRESASGFRRGNAQIESEAETPFSKGELSRATVRCPYHKAVLMCMAAAGLFYPKNFANCGGGKWSFLLSIYSTLILLLLSFNTVRVLATAFDRSAAVNASFFSEVTTVTWTSLVTVNYAIHYVICFKKERGIANYYVKLDEAREALRALGIGISWRGTRRFEVGCLVISVLFLFANVALTAPQLVGVKSSDMMAPLLRVRPGNDTSQSEYAIMGYVMTVNYVYCMAAWIFPVSYVLVISKHISTLFDSFNKALELAVTSRSERLFSGIGSYRLAYCRIKKIVSFVDGYFRFLYGLHFAAYLALSMLQLYLILLSDELRQPGSSAMLGGMIEWFASSVIIILLELGASCVVLNKAKECGEYLQDIPADGGCSTNEQLTQLHLLLSNVKEDTGFTIFSCLLVSNDAVFTILGTWMTYFLIILQYGSPSA